MKLYIKTIAIAALFLFTLTGCSFTQPQAPQKANTLIEDLSLLKQSPKDEDTFYYINKDTDFSNYNNVTINPIKIITDLKETQVDEKLIKDVSIYFQNRLNEEVKPVYQNNEKGSRSVHLSISIISLNASYDDLKIYQYLPYGLAFTALKRGSGFEKRKLRTSLALKLYDSKTLKTLVLVIDAETGREVKDIENISLDDVKPALDRWAKRYKLRTQELIDGKYKKILEKK